MLSCCILFWRIPDIFLTQKWIRNSCKIVIFYQSGWFRPLKASFDIMSCQSCCIFWLHHPSYIPKRDGEGKVKNRGNIHFIMQIESCRGFFFLYRNNVLKCLNKTDFRVESCLDFRSHMITRPSNRNCYDLIRNQHMSAEKFKNVAKKSERYGFLHNKWIPQHSVVFIFVANYSMVDYYVCR